MRNIIFCIILLLVIFGVGMVGKFSVGGNATLREYADKLLAKCTSSGHRPACYDEKIPKLMDVISMEEAFEFSRLIQEKDNGYFYCHVRGHNLSTKETAKNPDKWKEVVARCPSNICSNGCIHGAFQERFRAESVPQASIGELKPELEGVCEKREGWNPTDMERATCYHALGHLSMYMTDANIQKSTGLCEEITSQAGSQGFTPICFDGAFMQIFQPLEPEDFALIEGKQPKREELASFCNEFEGYRKGSCWNEGWPLFLQEVTTPEGVVKFCSTLKEPFLQDRCYNAMFYVVPAQFRLDETRMKEFCSKLPDPQRAQCFASAASRFIETDASLVANSARMCEYAARFGAGDQCFQELLFYSTYNFHPGSEEFFKLCSALPQPWTEKCLSGYNE
jgi:hypothetical protein